jgi:hypothetical protein
MASARAIATRCCCPPESWPVMVGAVFETTREFFHPFAEPELWASFLLFRSDHYVVERGEVIEEQKF